MATAPSVLCGKRAYELAIDLTLIPYHGQPAGSDAELLRNTAKAGTTHFHGYATVAIVHHHHRYVMAFTFVHAGTPMVTIVRALLNRVRRLGSRIKLVLVDKGFYPGAVFHTLTRRRLGYIVPLRLGAQHRLFHKGGSYRTFHRLEHAHGGAHTVYAVVLRRFTHLRKGRREAGAWAMAVADGHNASVFASHGTLSPTLWD